jgi:hypothetical protein
VAAHPVKEEVTGGSAMDLLDPVLWALVVLVAALAVGLFNRCDARRARQLRKEGREELGRRKSRGGAQ